MSTKARRVYPVPDHFLVGVPHVEHDCTDKFCVESGAFTEKPSPKAASKSEGPPSGGPLDSKET